MYIVHTSDSVVTTHLRKNNLLHDLLQGWFAQCSRVLRGNELIYLKLFVYNNTRTITKVINTSKLCDPQYPLNIPNRYSSLYIVILTV